MKKIVFSFFVLALLSCESDTYYELQNQDTTIHLKWNKGYADETMDKSLIGLKWALSYVGASLPSSNSGFTNTNSVITIDINNLGFSEKAQQLLLKLNNKIKITEEYKTTDAVDLGRYITLLLGASEHYYAMVETPEKLNQVLANYTLLPQKGYVNNSGVSLEHRIIQFSAQNGFNQVFLSKEVNPVSGAIEEYETIELLPNGQLRFGIFDANGNRENNANEAVTNAGKPAKCMWCHESVISQMYTEQDDFSGYLSFVDFQNTLIDYRSSHHQLKTTLTNGVDFTKTQQHTLTELLYISFMEPSAERLSIEWNMPLAQVQSLLAGLPTHVHDEFTFLGTLYNRNDLENFAPFKGLSVSTSVREASSLEVNHLN
jgi:hypothetical protein